MRRASLSAGGRGVVLATAVATLAVFPDVRSPAQSAPARLTVGGAILVQVTDTSINPLPAEVVLPALGLGVRLSDEGALIFLNVPDGLYLVQARYAGHASAWRLVRVTDDTARVEFVLAPDGPRKRRKKAAASAGIVEARLIYFMSRTSVIPLGSFITRGEIRRRGSRTLTDLLARARDVRVDRTKPGRPIVRSAESTGGVCESGMLVFIDGMPLAAPALAAGGDRKPARSGRGGWRVRAGGQGPASPSQALRWVGPLGRDLVRVAQDPSSSNAAPPDAIEHLDRIPISTVAAVEVYPTLDAVPGEFLVAGAECGVIVVWTEEASARF